MEIVVILFLILLSGIFSMSEISLISARKSKLEISAKSGSKTAVQALELINKPSRFLSTVLIGNTLVNILTGLYSGARLKGYVSPYLQNLGLNPQTAESLAIGGITLIVTFLTLIFGELFPKRIGLALPEEISKIMVKPMNLLSKIALPFIWLLSKTSDLLFKLTGIKESDKSVTEEEIKNMVQDGASSGNIEEIEHEIVQNVFHLGDRTITSLMTSINEVNYLDIDDEFELNKNKIIESRHSIYPVCKDELNDIKGLLYIKDLLGRDLDDTLHDLEPILRPALFIAENNHAYKVLEKFQEERIHFGIIVDEYGSFVGIVTMNDILDALVGDISESDEFEFEITEREDGSFLIDAALPFDEFLNEFDIHIPNRKEYTGFDTMSGFTMFILREIPSTGEKFIWENYSFEIIDMDKNRVDKILVTKIETPEEEGKE